MVNTLFFFINKTLIIYLKKEKEKKIVHKIYMLTFLSTTFLVYSLICLGKFGVGICCPEFYTKQKRVLLYYSTIEEKKKRQTNEQLRLESYVSQKVEVISLNLLSSLF